MQRLSESGNGVRRSKKGAQPRQREGGSCTPQIRGGGIGCSIFSSLRKKKQHPHPYVIIHTLPGRQRRALGEC